MQVVGLGTQDDFEFAYSFIERGQIERTTMLWDPSFATWSIFGVQANSQFIVLSPDLQSGSDLVYGFTNDVQQQLVEIVSEI